MITFAERLWRDIKGGRLAPKEAFDILIRARPDEDYARQVRSIPAEMFSAFAAHVSGVHTVLSGPDWFSEASDTVTMHAFAFDIDKARAWKTARVALIHSLCEERVALHAKDENA